MFANLKPINEKVLVKREAKEEKTVNGLYLSTESDTRSNTGTVLAIGEGRFNSNGVRIPSSVKVGDKIYFQKFAGIELDSDYVVLREEEIIGIL